MICPKCQKEIAVKNQAISHDSNNRKNYDRIVYWCQQDDIWVNIETPKEV